jgi:two-component system chemotaxis response regulator CheY
MSQTALIDLSNVSVLCVDDDPVIRSVVRFALQGHGCQDVVLAHSAVEALDICAGRKFDLLICDLYMTPMTGIEFLRELISSGLGDGWPVIMLSGETAPDTIHDSQQLGVRAWIGKPVSVQVLIETVGAVLQRSGQISRSREDPEARAMVERHHARIMAGLRTAEETTRALALRPREIVILAQTLRRALDDITENAQTLGYELVAMLAARAIELTDAVARKPDAAARQHAAEAGAFGTLITAMRRVAQNRMEGDGGVAGLKLLQKIDGIIGPVRNILR